MYECRLCLAVLLARVSDRYCMSTCGSHGRRLVAPESGQIETLDMLEQRLVYLTGSSVRATVPDAKPGGLILQES